MKYIVMECHEGYAVLMDEESRFVNAANMHYEVGQSVTDPIIMNEEHNARRITFTVGKLIAAAACLVIFASAGSIYYSRNLKPHSTVLISSDANIRLEVNKKGKVLHIVSDSEIGKDILKNYNGKGKDKLTVTNEILELEKEKGIISDGDTIDVYISSDNSDDYRSIKSDLEKGITDVNVEVHGIDSLKKPAKPTEGVKKPEPPKPDAEKSPDKNVTGKIDTPKNPDQAAVTPPAPVDPPAPAVQPPKTDNSKADAPAPPAPPENAGEPEPPKAPEKQGDAEAPKPDAHGEPAKPALPNEGELPHPEHEIHEKLSADTDISERVSFNNMNPVMLLPEPKQEEEPPQAAEPPIAEPPAPEALAPEAGIPPQPPVLP
ncbi:MAG: hypothetical protein K5898_14580 [Ruminococcus sp.]|uniref:anti-sigma-I factor RsgI family protein n=1 Tax=Ruminococcus sp. TaxID=41978 RepID=UPI0025D93DC6|nr:hypothetical protein [Ruminococcus sp.]MCR4796364.1 hypothetical protein [Ruminococcus sp.]